MASTLAGAVAALIAVNEDRVAHFAERAKELPAPSKKIEGVETTGLGPDFNLVEISPDATKILESLPKIRF